MSLIGGLGHGRCGKRETGVLFFCAWTIAFAQGISGKASDAPKTMNLALPGHRCCKRVSHCLVGARAKKKGQPEGWPKLTHSQ
ncbi:MAG TPA: hypothetical protein VGN04_08295 [Herbaspirillum sp.]